MSQTSTQPEAGDSSTGVNYTEISAEDFKETLTERVHAKEIDHPNCDELAFEIPVPHDRVSIRVLSSIVNGKGRSKGKDAIRVIVWDNQENLVVTKASHTKRIEGWIDNLMPKIEKKVENYRDYTDECWDCGALCAIRRKEDYENVTTTFYSCPRYRCDHTHN